MIHYLSIAIGGALGAMGRYFLATYTADRMGMDFPWGTLLVNICGSLLLGVLYVMIMESSYMSEEWKYVIIAGFLGAFTTFSTFSLEAVLLFQQGQINTALMYILSSVVCCLLALAIGLWLTRFIGLN